MRKAENVVRIACKYQGQSGLRCLTSGHSRADSSWPYIHPVQRYTIAQCSRPNGGGRAHINSTLAAGSCEANSLADNRPTKALAPASGELLVEISHDEWIDVYSQDSIGSDDDVFELLEALGKSQS